MRKTHDFKDQVVLITGGSRGLGFILAQLFAREGAVVAICSRDAEELERAKVRLEQLGGRVYTMTCDVSDRVQVESMIGTVVQRLGRIDVLVNNAGIMQVGPVDQMSVGDFEQIMSVNFWGTVYPTLAVIPEMAAAGGGRIMNITSIGGAVSVPHLLPYSSSKFAAVGFSEGLRAEVARHGIRVTTIVPGLMRTGSFIHALFKGNRQSEYAWFSAGGAFPLISMDAERAAARMVEACRRGEALVTVGLPAKVLRLMHALLPGTTVRMLSLVDRLLPKPQPGNEDLVEGTALERPPGTGLGARAARKFNERAG